MGGSGGRAGSGTDDRPCGGKGCWPAGWEMGMKGVARLIDFTIALTLGKRETEYGIARFIEPGRGLKID